MRTPLSAESRALAPAPISLSVHHDFAAVEADWRRFEGTADCTPFQTFDWLFAWQRHVGTAKGITPAIVIARRGDQLLLLLPLGIARRGFARCLTFLGDVLCDYNAPLLAPDFADARARWLPRAVAATSAGCCRKRPQRATTSSRSTRCLPRSAGRTTRCWRSTCSSIRAAPMRRSFPPTGSRSIRRSARPRPAAAIAPSSSGSASSAPSSSSTRTPAPNSR